VGVATAPQAESGTTAAKELAALDLRRRDLENRLNDLDRQQREATEQVNQRSAELADLERRAAAGERVSAQARTKAEEALTQARLRHAEPWAERAAGVQAAIREAEQGKRAFVTEHLDELLGELVEDANAAAEDVNHAAQRLLDAYQQRQAVEQRVTALCGLVRPVTAPGAIRATRAEALAREAQRLLGEGGEVAPLPHVDPREPVSV